MKPNTEGRKAGSQDGDGHGVPMAIMASIRSESQLEAALEELPRAPLEALQHLWARRYGRPPPRTLSRRLLELAAAYDLQARFYGDLKPALRRKLLQMASNGRADSAGQKLWKPKSLPPPGSRLVREWHGRTHTVEVTDRGYLYAGRQFRSLSEIAREITGARWSGPRFFGL